MTRIALVAVPMMSMMPPWSAAGPNAYDGTIREGGGIRIGRVNIRRDCAGAKIGIP